MTKILELLGGWQSALLLSVFVGAIGFGIVYTYNHAILRAERAETDLKASEQALKDTQQALTTMTNKKKELDNLLVEKQADEQKDREEEKDFTSRLSILREKQKHVDFWAGTKLPINALTGKLRK